MNFKKFDRKQFGVNGLINAIKLHNLYEFVDLVDIAKNNRIEIIVDTYSLVNDIIRWIIEKTSKDYENDFLFAGSIESDILNDVFYDLQMSFAEAGIDLVWVIQLSKELTERFPDNILKEYVESDIKYLDRYKELFELLRSGKKFHHSFPWFDSFKRQLRRADAMVIYHLENEESDVIAKIYNQRKSFGIISRDSDFIMFEGCNVFPESLAANYDMNIMNLPFISHDTPGKIFKRPSELRLSMVNCDHVMRFFNISHDQLIFSSMLMKNPITKDRFQFLEKELKNDSSMRNIVRFVKEANFKSSTFVNNIYIRRYASDHGEGILLVKECFKYYTLTRPPPDNSDNDDLTEFIINGIKTHDTSFICLRMHKGKFISKLYMEDLPQETQSINELLINIRMQLYPYILAISLNNVQEYKPRGNYILDNVTNASLRDRFVEKIWITHSNVKTNHLTGVPDGLQIFEQIWSHLETESLDYVKRFGLEKAFILYLLRYLYKITKDVNLRLSEQEFKAIFVAVLYRYSINPQVPRITIINRESFLRMSICPSPRCVTIMTWFSMILDTAYYFCTGVLNLTQHFNFQIPSLNGSELFAFFEMFAGDNFRYEHLDSELINAVRMAGSEIVDIFRDEYDLVTHQ